MAAKDCALAYHTNSPGPATKAMTNHAATAVPASIEPKHSALTVSKTQHNNRTSLHPLKLDYISSRHLGGYFAIYSDRYNRILRGGGLPSH